ncbi:MAG: hypothetical protein ILP07_11650 [Treponema sp.]|nr:hypothetical protein [Treponema sp.]
MLKKFLTASLVFLTVTGFIFASPRGKQELVNSDSWIYGALTALSMESGRSCMADETPITIGEIESILLEVEREKLSAAGQAQYDRIVGYIAHGGLSVSMGLLSFGVDPELNLEGYYKSNDDLDWVYDRYYKQPIVSAPVTFMAGDYFTMGMEVELSMNHCAFNRDDNYLNIPISSLGDLDINFPHFAYGSTGIMLNENTGVNLRAGLGTQSIGRALTGSIMMSEYFTDASYLNLEIFSPFFRYNMNVTEFNVDKYLYTHRFNVRFFKKLQFTVMESMLVNAPLELRFLNPLTIFHGTAAWEDYGGHEIRISDYLCLGINYVPVPYLRIYGQFAMNQWQTIYERTNWPNDTTPNSLAFQLGTELFYPISEGYLHAWIEGVYTDPYMYIKEGPNWSLVRTYRENVGDMDPIYEWLGSSFGPDTIAGKLSAGYEVPGKWNVGASYLFAACGEYSGSKVFTEALNWGGVNRYDEDLDEWVYPNADKPTQGFDEAKRRQSWLAPHGTPEFINQITLSGGWNPTDYLSLSAQPSLVFVFNRNNIEGNFEIGWEFALSSKLIISRMFK